MSYIMFLRQLRHLPTSFSIFPSLSVGKCASDVSAQSERHKNGSGETYRPEVNHFVWSLLCDTFFVPLVARKCTIIIRSFVILPRPLTGKKCIFYILFLKTFLSFRVLEYSVYCAFQNIQYFPCFRISCVFRNPATPFHPSTIPSNRVTLTGVHSSDADLGYERTYYGAPSVKILFKYFPPIFCVIYK